MGITITAFRQSPDRGRGLARDMPVRWALEEAGLLKETLQLAGEGGARTLAQLQERLDILADDAVERGDERAEAILGAAHITCNKNGIPNDPQKPMVTSGIRLGSPAMTTRGFKEEQAVIVGNLIADVLDNPHDEANLARVREQVSALTRQFPVYR